MRVLPLPARRALTIAALECRSVITGPLFFIMLALIAVGTMSIGTDAFIRGDQAPGAPRALINSQFAMAQVFCLTGAIFYGFFASILAGRSVLRDDECQVSELLHGTPLRASEYVTGKFLGTASTLALAILWQIAFAIGYHQLRPIADPDILRGPFALSNFVIPALAFAAPCALLYAGLAFAVGARTRRAVLVFAVPISIFVISTTFLWTWSPPWMGSGLDRLLMILEPSGLRWLLDTHFEPSRGTAFYNTAPLAFDATFAIGRAVIVLTAMVCMLAVIPYCRRHTLSSAPAPKRRRTRSIDAAAASPPSVPSKATAPLAALEMRQRPPGWLSGTLHLARLDLRNLLRQPALIVFALLTISMVVESATSSGAFGAPRIATAGTLAVGSIDLLTLILCLGLLAYLVESMMRERTTRFDALLFATPMRTSSLLVAKAIAGTMLVGLITAVAILTGALILGIAPLSQVDVGPLILVWGWILLPTYFVWSAFVLVVLAISNSRYVTYGLGLAALIATFVLRLVGKTTWLTNWPLWGTLRWSDMGVFALNGYPLLLNRLLMTGLGAALLILAIVTVERVERDRTRAIGRHVRRNLGYALRLAPAAVPTAIVAFMLAGALENGFQSDAAARKAKDYWRANVATWHDAVPPTLTHVDLDLDLFPSSRRMKVSGIFTLRNDSSTPMARLPFTVDPAFEDLVWTVDGDSTPSEDRDGLHVLDVPSPLSPGGAVRVGFRYAAEVPRGITRNGGGTGQFILPSGIVLHNLRNAFIPTPGFVAGRGIDEGNRHEPTDLTDTERRRVASAQSPVARYTTRITVTAPSDFTVNTVGTKLDESTKNGRTTAVWESDHPVSAINVVGGRYDVVQRGNTAVYFHPDHGQNADAMLDVLVAAREHYSAWFSAYPWRDLRLNEFPDLVPNAQGFPTNISFSEGIGFLNRMTATQADDDALDLAFLVTAHEAAHQWWGNLVSAAEGPGTTHLVEGMAHYAALRLQGAVAGDGARKALARHMESNYLRTRSVDSELPLAMMIDDREAEDWTVVYEKGAWVMWMLERHLGEEAMLEGLRRFVARYGDAGDRPFLDDLVETLAPLASDADAYKRFVDQWFFQVVVPEVVIRAASAEPVEGRWQVSATVENIGDGTIELALVAVTESGDARTATHLDSGVARVVTWWADAAPAQIVADPDVVLLQRNRDQAVYRLDQP